MYLPIEMKVGGFAVGICPMELRGRHPFQNMIIGKIAKIFIKRCADSKMHEKHARLRAEQTLMPNGQTINQITEYDLPEWRIPEFDFGGVQVNNSKFDPGRIAKEDQTFLQP